MNNTIENNRISKVRDLISMGLDSWVKAGEIIVEMLDHEGLTLADISEAIGTPVGILSRFEQLGRKNMMPRLLIANYPASRNLQALPYSEQSRLIDGSVEVLTADGDDKINILTKNLTTKQCQQVFSSKEVRDIPSQRAWVESRRRRSKDKIIISGMPYHIKNGEVIFEKGCSMKASQLVNILAQLTTKK